MSDLPNSTKGYDQFIGDEKMTIEQVICVKWKYKIMGSFYRGLMSTIANADVQNLERLHRGFPQEVDAYKLYTGVIEPGSHWWDRTVDRGKKCGMIVE